MLRITASASSGVRQPCSPDLRLADPQLRVLAAPPMDRQDDLARRLVDIGNDVGDQRAEQPLARAHGHAWRVPGGSRSSASPAKSGAAAAGSGVCTRVQSRLARLDAPERRLPALLELRGDEAIVGIAGSVAPFRERGFVAGLLQLQLHDALLFALASMCLRSASTAASIAIGSTARRSSRAIAASTRRPPKVKQRGSPSIRLGRSQR